VGWWWVGSYPLSCNSQLMLRLNWGWGWVGLWQFVIVINIPQPGKDTRWPTCKLLIIPCHQFRDVQWSYAYIFFCKQKPPTHLQLYCPIKSVEMSWAQFDYMVYEEVWWSLREIWTMNFFIKVQASNPSTNNDMLKLCHKQGVFFVWLLGDAIRPVQYFLWDGGNCGKIWLPIEYLFRRNFRFLSGNHVPLK
jgi:hypothetical protein